MRFHSNLRSGEPIKQKIQVNKSFHAGFEFVNGSCACIFFKMLRMSRKSNGRIALIAVIVVALDQLTKWAVLKYLPTLNDEKVVMPGFFKFVHWTNTGAAWSLFPGNNGVLAIVAIAALVILFFTRHHFDSGTRLGLVAFGMIFGGIIGNLVDRLLQSRQHVVDFIYFYLNQRGGKEIGFPAFNIADSAICIGVGLVFLINLRGERNVDKTTEPAETPS